MSLTVDQEQTVESSYQESGQPVHQSGPASVSNFFLKTWPLLVLSLVTLLARLLTAPGIIESRDGLFFTRGLDRYSVLEMRPHWPGYPVYIWAGYFFKLFTDNNAQALHLVAIFASTLTLWPVAGLAAGWRRYVTPDPSEAEVRLAGFAAAALWALVPLSWQGGTEIFSDPLAMLLAVTMLWLCWQAVTKSTGVTAYLAVAAVLAGLTLGVRLSYVALLLPLFFATWLNRKQNGKLNFKLLWITGISFFFSIGMWLDWQFIQEGSKFIEAGTRHLAGHYSEWGGSITTDHNELTRPVRFFETGLVYGLGGWWTDTPWQRLPLTLMLLVLLVASGIRLVTARYSLYDLPLFRRNSPAGQPVKSASLLKALCSTSRLPLVLSLLWSVPYFFWILLGNDVDLARYCFPLVAIACIWIGMGLPRGKKLATVTLLVLLIAEAVVSVPLGIEHHTSLPITHRLANYMNQYLDPATSTVVVGDALSPLMFFTEENAPKIPSERVLDVNMTGEVAKLEAQGKTVYGTYLPNTAPQGWQPVIRLCRSRFMESRGPLEVWLYRHAPGAAPAPLPGCY
ncbi:MAG TPA: DUF2723 domain-containing protein [Chloroflexia bacterium]|nr:DUF2723 domain-containing protein [Chloroflexia bacterium]